MTFEQAKQQCVDYGTTIATPQHLLQARSMGYGPCQCGWLSDGSIGLVLQSYQPACFDIFDEGILICYQEKADVFCILE